MFSKILFPIDGLGHYNKNFYYVRDLSKAYNCQVVVLNCYNVPALYTIEYEEDLKKTGFSLLNKIEEKFKKNDIDVKTILSEGYAGKIITDIAERENCNLIVIGSHSLSEVKTFLLGSISNYVIHHAKCPVLLINK